MSTWVCVYSMCMCVSDRQDRSSLYIAGNWLPCSCFILKWEKLFKRDTVWWRMSVYVCVRERVNLSVCVFVSKCVCLYLCVCLCVLLFKKTRPGCWNREISAMVTRSLHLKRSAHMVLKHNVWRGSEGWADPCGWSVKWGKRQGDSCSDSRGVKRWKKATEARTEPKCWSKCWTERSVVSDQTEKKKRFYHLLWFWGVWGCWEDRHPTVYMPAPAAHTWCIFGGPQGAATHSPLLLPPEHWEDLLNPSLCTTPEHRHTQICHTCIHIRNQK